MRWAQRDGGIVIGADLPVKQSAPARLRARVVNPVVCALLRSPVHGVLSGSLLVLGYTGRRSGRQYTLPVMYAAAGNDLIVVAGHHTAKSWWRNFRSDAQPVRVTVRGREGLRAARRPHVDSDEYRSSLQAYRRRFPKAVIDPAAPVLLLTRSAPALGGGG